MYVQLGIDDTDSRQGGCTTHLASEVVRLLVESDVKFFDYPNLIRLNPNIPWKTKGNAAVSLRFEAEKTERIFHKICAMSSKHGGEGANPGLVMFEGREVPAEVREFSKCALSNTVSMQRALNLLRRHGMNFFGEGNGMGLIGALAAIGETLEGDHTYELLAYRVKENWGSKRRINAESVVAMSEKTHPYTYNNYDSETGRILITPHGPDPVFFGIRGETANHVVNAFHMISVGEPVDRYLVFRTNQGTGSHLLQTLDLGCLKAYTAGYVIGTLSQRPWTGQGGHVYFKIRNGEAEAPCAVYEPAGGLRQSVLKLIPGDKVEVGGGVRRRTMKHPSIINVEYVKVLSLIEDHLYHNPFCDLCGRRMTSQGRAGGYRCRTCGYEDKVAKKVVKQVPRSMEIGLYLPPSRAHRHLTKPTQRYGLEKNCWDGIMTRGWFGFSDVAI